ncbi:GNAT family N-acetyltransferase [Gulosibacter sp. 10]|uniref:GNAT family N-acetyltransferase n=1 Tax=Gulosibacter sp. 10 TaxID=1255570 RepID=UPI0020CED548|nr:GNAT family protein [Gulosibacter sp. 10]
MTDAARGRGWTAAAAATISQWALTTGGLERLELGHRVNNPASGAVARRAGFVKEGTEREKFLVGGQRIDVDTYGRLRSDPLPSFDPVPMIDG